MWQSTAAAVTPDAYMSTAAATSKQKRQKFEPTKPPSRQHGYAFKCLDAGKRQFKPKHEGTPCCRRPTTGNATFPHRLSPSKLTCDAPMRSEVRMRKDAPTMSMHATTTCCVQAACLTTYRRSAWNPLSSHQERRLGGTEVRSNHNSRLIQRVDPEGSQEDSGRTARVLFCCACAVGADEDMVNVLSRLLLYVLAAL